MKLRHRCRMCGKGFWVKHFRDKHEKECMQKAISAKIVAMLKGEI